MQTLEEAAQERADKFSKIIVEETEIPCLIEDLNLWSKEDFKAGFEFANKWYSVNEEIPDNYNCQILVRKLNDNVFDLRFFQHANQFKLICEIHKYTHWRSIF